MTFRSLIRMCLVVSALILAFGCESISSTQREYLEDLRPYVSEPKRPVIVIPGFANSKLYDPITGYYVWGTPRSVMHTRYADNLDLPIDDETYDIGFDRLIPRGGFAGSRSFMNIGWHLSRALQRYADYLPSDSTTDSSAKIYPFGYDWRLSAVDNAVRLDAFIEEIRRKQNDPALKVDIVAHSGGGMIVTAYLKLGTAPLDRPDLWDSAAAAAASKVGRAVLMSVPQEGTAEALRVLVRGDWIVRRGLTPELVAGFPSIPEFLPSNGSFLVDESGAAVDADLWNIEDWKKLGISLYEPKRRASLIAERGEKFYETITRAFAKSIERAATVRKALARPFPENVGVHVIAGDCVPTAERVLLRKDGSFVFYPYELRPEEKAVLDKQLFGGGDGSITVSSAKSQVAQVETYCYGHQGMAGDPHVHRGMIRALLE